MTKPLNVRFSSQDLYKAAMDYSQNHDIEHLSVLLYWAGDRLKAYERLLERLLDTDLLSELEITQDRLYELRDEFMRKNFKNFAPPVDLAPQKIKLSNRRSKKAKVVEQKLQNWVDELHKKPDNVDSYQWENAIFVPPKKAKK